MKIVVLTVMLYFHSLPTFDSGVCIVTQVNVELKREMDQC